MKGRMFLAIALIAIGLVLLLNNLGMGVLPRKLELWPVLLMALGAAIGADALRNKEKDPLFGAVILFFVGLLFLLTESGYLVGGLGKLWPVFIIILGMAFISNSFMSGTARGLIIGLIYAAVGFVLLASTYGKLSIRIDLVTYWPVILIVLGLATFFQKAR
ncbi:MAG TPA: DUF5668 domain-containing protein [Bacillota bacterium]|nr:DUF5668 domain-containing protein [Bacillota bacterium]HOH09456.1 DUF5668 domain-containing protein [Bacillota bacterium]HOS49994.1 DUF5668 domain-containing protein [Bacillota bacterium]HOY88151.1 DUF5668 domain-containing protein [Bacillota bacterium]HPI00963.1 DUF5668 domain-containing protein [Bacillota bacterium]